MSNYRIIVGGKVEILLGISAQVGAILNPERNAVAFESAKDFFRSLEGWEQISLAKSVGSFGGVTEACFNIRGWVRLEDMQNVESWLRRFAYRFNQLDVFISESVDGSHPNARPVVYYWTMQRGLEDTLTAVSCIVKDTGIDGFLIDDRGAKNKRIMGVYAQYVPEIAMRWDAGHKVDRFGWLKKAVGTPTICSTEVSWWSTRVFTPGQAAEHVEVPNILDEIRRRADALAVAP